MNKKSLLDSQSNFLLYASIDGQVKVDVFLQDETLFG